MDEGEEGCPGPTRGRRGQELGLRCVHSFIHLIFIHSFIHSFIHQRTDLGGKMSK